MTTPHQGIDVDLEQLRISCTGIRDDTDRTLGPGISDANGQIFRGLNLGNASQSGEVEATRRALAYAMNRFWRKGVDHLERAERMVEFLDNVIANYKTTEDFAKLDVDAVLAKLDEIARRKPAPSPPAQSPRGFVE